MSPRDNLFSAGGARRLRVTGMRRGERFEADDDVAEEVPVALEFNGLSHAVMLATPLDLEDFALGFALSEGLLSSRRELYGVEVEPSARGITVRLEVASAAFVRLKERRRNLAGRTGCGLCGTESLDQVLRPLTALPDGPVFDRRAIGRAMDGLRAGQTLQRSTGAVHAAAWCDASGVVRLLREDVGRHNALDKLIGAIARGVEPAPGRTPETAPSAGASTAAASAEVASPAGATTAWASTAGMAPPRSEASASATAEATAARSVQGATTAAAAPSPAPPTPRSVASPTSPAATVPTALAGFFAVTSRASFEMVQKTVSAGVPLLAAVSAPTALAIETAAAARLTLVGFARGDDFVVYAGSERIAFRER